MEKDKWGSEVMTVAELIEALKAMPQDAFVYHQGCDCTGNASGVVLEEDGSVLIERNN